MIPATVTSIGDYAFYGCTYLNSLTLLNPSLITLTALSGTNAFNGTSTTPAFAIHVPGGTAALYKAAPNWLYYASIIS
jgi:hypothetical protein